MLAQNEGALFAVELRMTSEAPPLQQSFLKRLSGAVDSESPLIRGPFSLVRLRLGVSSISLQVVCAHLRRTGSHSRTYTAKLKVVLGSACGKTALVTRLISNTFVDSNPSSTNGILKLFMGE